MSAIRDFRERHGLSQTELAAALGMSRRAVQGHELSGDLPRRLVLALRGLEVEITSDQKSLANSTK